MAIVAHTSYVTDPLVIHPGHVDSHARDVPLFFSTIENAAASSKELDSSQIQTFYLGRGYALTYCSDYYGVPK